MSVCIAFCLCCTFIRTHRMDSMLFTYLLRVAMFALPNTLLLWWEFTCLISLMTRRQHSTGQPWMDTCQWWNTLSKVLDLMSKKTRTRSLCKRSSLMTSLVSFFHGYLYSVKCHICTTVLFCSFMAAVRDHFRGLHLPFCMQLQEVTSTYECDYNGFIHQHCL